MRRRQDRLVEDRRGAWPYWLVGTMLALVAVYLLRRSGWQPPAVGGTPRPSAAQFRTALTAVGAVIALVGLGFTAATFARAGSDRRRESRKQRGDLAGSVRGCSGKGRLPLVEEISDLTSVGVTRVAEGRRLEPSESQLPYVPRDSDEALVSATRDARALVVTGQAKAGKSRSAFEAVRVAYPDRRLVVPEPKGGLQRLLQLGFDFAQSVVWLDDLDVYLAEDGINASMVQHVLSHRGAVIVATMRRTTYNDVRADPASRAVLNLARVFELSHQLSRQEAARAADVLRTGEASVDELQASGLGGFLTGAEDLVRAYEQAEADRSLVFRLVQAAIDAALAGAFGPISVGVLKELAQRRLARDRGNEGQNSSDDWAVAFETAFRPVLGSMAMLERPLAGMCVANSYLVDRMVETAPTSPDPLLLGDLVDLLDGVHHLISLALAAPRVTMPTVKRKFAQRAASSDDGTADLALGFIEAALGRTRQSVKWFHSAHEKGRANAAHNLGVAQEVLGQAALAKQWFTESFQTENDLDSALALLKLAEADGLEPDEDVVAALVKSTDPAVSHVVGNVLGRHWELPRIEAWHLARTRRGDTHAWTHLGLLALAYGNESVALTRFRKAAAAGDVGGIYHAAMVLQRRGDIDGAEALLLRLDELGHAPPYVALARIANSRKRFAEAERYAKRAADANPRDAEAVTLLVMLLARRGEWRQGLRYSRKLGKNGNADACFRTAVTLQAIGRAEEAQLWLREFRRLSGLDLMPLPGRTACRLALALGSNRFAYRVAQYPWLQRKVRALIDSTLSSSPSVAST